MFPSKRERENFTTKTFVAKKRHHKYSLLTAGAKKAETSPAQRTVIENLSRDCTDEGYECGVQEASPGNQA
jgi:hypothetical protein